MRKLLFFFLAIALAFSVSAQDKKAKTKKTKPAKPATAWKAGGSISILGGGGTSGDHYSGLSDEAGFVYGGYVKLYADKSWGRNVWTNSIMGGYLRTTGDDDKEPNLNENKVELNIRYGYKLKKERWQPGVMLNARTQICNGYDYSYPTRKRTSGFFAPAFVTLGVGTNLELFKNFDVFIGPAVRWVTVTNRPYSLNYQGGVKPDGSTEPTLASYYNVDPEKQVRYETGALINLSWKKEFAKKVTIKSRAQFINDFRSNAENFDVYWTTGIGVNLGKWFTINGNFDVIYDDDIRSKVMYRGFAGIGAICRF
jgi:hypothetical protein